MKRFTLVLIGAAILSGCDCGSGGNGDGGVVDSGANGGGGGAGGGGGDGGSFDDAGYPVEGLELMQKLGGLWSGPASQTPLGNFPVMNVDFRNATDRFLYGRTDLDAQNNLRFGISIETYDGGNVLSYRNGGYFQNVLRDSRTKLVATDGGSYQFCDVNQGCSYINAQFTFTQPDSLIFDVKVRGNQHVYWTPQRVETRTLPSPFPTDYRAYGDGKNPWPAMATLNTTVNWATALTASADVWIILTTTACAPTFQCKASRSIKASALSGATTATLTLSEVHSGSYFVSAIVDKNGDFATTRMPNSGDLLAVDVPVSIAPPTTALTASATYTVP